MEDLEFNSELVDALKPYIKEQSVAVRINDKNAVYIGNEYTNVYGNDLFVESIIEDGCLCKVYPLGTLSDGTKWSTQKEESLIRICSSMLGEYKPVANRYLKLMRLTAEELLFEEYDVEMDDE